MTDNSEVLGEYKGLPITGTAIVVNRLGDGLSDAVDVEPIVPDVGEDVFIVCRLRKTKERYDALRDADGTAVSYKLIQIFDSTGAMFTDAKMAVAGIAKMLERIRKAKVAASGQLDLEITGASVTDIDAARGERGEAK